MNAQRAPRTTSQSLAIGLVTLAVLVSAATGFTAGRATAAVRTELGQAASAQAATTGTGASSFRAAEHQGSAENPNATVANNIQFLAAEHQGSSENPDATRSVLCAGPGCWEK